LGNKRYELTNHLGNVLATISDRKVWNPNDGVYEPVLSTRADYYAFGMLMPGRNEGLGDQRHGFQGQEMDNEIKGEGNAVNYKYRMHDPRLGRFFTLDPLKAEYPHNSPYAFSENRVIDAVELEGLEKRKITTYEKNKNENSNLKKINDENVDMFVKKCLKEGFSLTRHGDQVLDDLSNVAIVMVDITTDIVPVISHAKSIYSLSTGVNIITGEELSGADKAMTWVGLFVSGVRTVGKIKTVVFKVSDQSVDKLVKVSEAGEYVGPVYTGYGHVANALEEVENENDKRLHNNVESPLNVPSNDEAKEIRNQIFNNSSTNHKLSDRDQRLIRDMSNNSGSASPNTKGERKRRRADQRDRVKF